MSRITRRRRSRCGTLGSGIAAPRIVFVELAPGAATVRDDVDAAQVVVVIKELLRSFLGGEGFNADPDELGDRAVRRDLIALEREERHAGRGVLLYPHARVVVLHGGRATAQDGDAGHPVVGVPGEGLGAPCLHVAVLVVGVFFAGRQVLADRRRVQRVVVFEHCAAFVGESADGVVDVATVLQGLLFAEGAGGGGDPA